MVFIMNRFYCFFKVQGAAKLETLRQYMKANADLCTSPNTKTVVVPRGDEWLTKIGLGMSMNDNFAE